jgi:hypothetical protein
MTAHSAAPSAMPTERLSLPQAAPIPELTPPANCRNISPRPDAAIRRGKNSFNRLRPMRNVTFAASLVALVAAGCASPYHADRGALVGGLTGAGAGAVVGNAVGNTAGGALIGAGLGAVTGNLIGAGLDENEARNRAMIEQQMGRMIPAGGVTTADVINMSRSGVEPQLIINHIRTNGVAKRIDANELIALQQEGVNRDVIGALQTTPPPQPAAQPGMPVPMAPAGYYTEYYYPVPRRAIYYGPPVCAPPPPVGIGFSYSSRHH